MERESELLQVRYLPLWNLFTNNTTMNAGDMTYRDIEIDGMKELLKENELEIARLRKELSKLREESDRLRKINNELTDKFNQTLHE